MEKKVKKFNEKNNIHPEVIVPASSHNPLTKEKEDIADSSKDDLMEFLSEILWQDEER